MPISRKNARRLWIGGAMLIVALGAMTAWWIVRARQAPGPLEAQALAQEAQLDRWAAVAEGSVSLATVRADLAAERGRERVGPRMRHVEDKLEAAFDASRSPVADVESAELEERWTEIQEALETLTRQVDEGEPAAVETVAALDASLRAIRP